MSVFDGNICCVGLCALAEALLCTEPVPANMFVSQPYFRMLSHSALGVARVAYVR